MEERLKNRILRVQRRRKYAYLYSPKTGQQKRYDKKIRLKRQNEFYNQAKPKEQTKNV